MSVFSSVIGFFEGRVKIYADSENKDALISFLLDNGISAGIKTDNEKGGVYTEISPALLKKIAPALDKLNIMVYIINIYGFKRIASRYRERYGLMLGAVLFVSFLWLSTLFIWRVDVSGTELLSKEQIRAELSEMGVSVGVRISDVDRSEILNVFLREHPELSWAALNFKGTTAVLILKETEEKPGIGGDGSRLLVASEGGVVRGVTVSEGVATVKVGTVVKKGDVLISGIISGSGGQITEMPPMRLTDAVGSVKAEVVRRAEVEVLFSEERTHTENADKKIFVISVFGLEIPLGSTDGALLLSEKNVTLFGSVELPVTVKEYAFPISVTETVVRDRESARLAAERRLYEKITEALGSGELTYLKTEFTETENGFVGRAEIGCVTEIAVPYKGLLKTE